MNSKIIILLFAFICYVEGCHKNSHSECSGSSNCNHHIRKRSTGEDAASENEQGKIDIQLKKSHYLVKLQEDPCNFETYDKNRNGVISLGELVDIFGIDMITKGVFKDIDAMKGDAAITPEEFDASVSLIIPVCNHSA